MDEAAVDDSDSSSDEATVGDIDSSSDDESRDGAVAQRGRKRVRNESKWRKNVKRDKVVRGETYRNASGRTVPAKKMGPACTCRRKCFSRIDVEIRDRNFAAFYALADKELQDAHLCGLISSRKVQRRRQRDGSRPERNETYVYRVSFSTGFLQDQYY